MLTKNRSGEQSRPTATKDAVTKPKCESQGVSLASAHVDIPPLHSASTLLPHDSHLVLHPSIPLPLLGRSVSLLKDTSSDASLSQCSASPGTRSNLDDYSHINVKNKMMMEKIKTENIQQMKEKEEVRESTP
ncbi:unnamed protein product [Leuciscus chuanchicus]